MTSFFNVFSLITITLIISAHGLRAKAGVKCHICSTNILSLDRRRSSMLYYLTNKEVIDDLQVDSTYFSTLAKQSTKQTALYFENQAGSDVKPNTLQVMSPNLAFVILNSVAILWGSQHVVIKTAVESYPSTSLLNFWRFLLSSLLFAYPALQLFTSNAATNDNPSDNKLDLIKAGIELGLYTFLGFSFQAIGLETTTAARSAFLLYLNVKIVPFLAAVLFSKSIPGSTWLSALMAFSGTCLLSTDGGPPNSGDVWCIAAAVASALFILRLENFAKLYNAAQLNGISFMTVSLLCSTWVVGDLIAGKLSLPESMGSMNIDTILSTVWEPMRTFPLPVLYLGLVTTGLCNYLQTIGQRYIPAERAAIIYSMDPVYGAVFSRLVLGEEFGVQGYVGAGLIMLGVLVSSRQRGQGNEISEASINS